MPNSWFSAPNESCNDLHTTQKPKTLSLNKHRNRTKSTLRRRRPRAIKRPRVADPCPERLRDTLAWSPTEYFLKFWMILAAMRHIASPLRVPPMSLTESLIGWYSEILSMLRTVEQCKGKTHKERFKITSCYSKELLLVRSVHWFFLLSVQKQSSGVSFQLHGQIVVPLLLRQQTALVRRWTLALG